MPYLSATEFDDYVRQARDPEPSRPQPTQCHPDPREGGGRDLLLVPSAARDLTKLQIPPRESAGIGMTLRQLKRLALT
jgi:hypothetical protein